MISMAWVDLITIKEASRLRDLLPYPSDTPFLMELNPTEDYFCRNAKDLMDKSISRLVLQRFCLAFILIATLMAFVGYAFQVKALSFMFESVVVYTYFTLVSMYCLFDMLRNLRHDKIELNERLSLDDPLGEKGTRLIQDYMDKVSNEVETGYLSHPVTKRDAVEILRRVRTVKGMGCPQCD